MSAKKATSAKKAASTKKAPLAKKADSRDIVVLICGGGTGIAKKYDRANGIVLIEGKSSNYEVPTTKISIAGHPNLNSLPHFEATM
ncbi:MAG: hypothetical protein WC238_01865 [Parcubacteria group bacterium]|jgi:hypothetical protein